jgi:hypothetical protein
MDRATTSGYGRQRSHHEECLTSYHHAAAGQGVVCNSYLSTLLSTGRSDGRWQTEQQFFRKSPESSCESEWIVEFGCDMKG